MIKKLLKVSLGVVFALTFLVGGAQFARAAAPAFTSATIQNSTSTTVDIVVVGTNFDKFVNANNATSTNATDLAGVTYNSQHPTTMIVSNATHFTATFPIAMGTNNSGGAFTIAADIIKSTTPTNNSSGSIATGSITDSAAPRVISVSPTDGSTGQNRSNPIVITFSEPMTTGTFEFSTTPSFTYTPTWSTGAYGANSVVSLAHNTLNTTQLNTESIDTATDAASVVNSVASLPYTWTFTTRSAGMTDTATIAVVPTETTLSINSGATTTSSHDVTLNLGAKGATAMIVANNPFFTGAGWESYAASKTWTLAAGDGAKTVYAKFISTDGVESALLSAMIEVTAATVAPTPAPTQDNAGSQQGGEIAINNPNIQVTLVPAYDFGTVTLKKGSSGDAVKALQNFLNDTTNAGLIADGKFGKGTETKVKAWQKTNGLKADGKFGKSSMEKAKLL